MGLSLDRTEVMQNKNTERYQKKKNPGETQKSLVIRKNIVMVISRLEIETEKVVALINIWLGYLKDSNAAAHSVDTGISLAVTLKRIENDIECTIYMLESTRIFTISL